MAIRSKEPAHTAAYVGRVQRLIYELARLMERCDEMCLAQHDITVSQAYGVLALPESGDANMNAVSEAIGVAGIVQGGLEELMALAGQVSLEEFYFQTVLQHEKPAEA